MLIVLVPFIGLSIHTLLAIQKHRRTIPNISQGINVECLLKFAFTQTQCPFTARNTNIDEANTQLIHEFLKLGFVGSGNLYNDTWVLGKEYLRKIILYKVIQVYLQTALCVGETHLE